MTARQKAADEKVIEITTTDKTMPRTYLCCDQTLVLRQRTHGTVRRRAIPYALPQSSQSTRQRIQRRLQMSRVVSASCLSSSHVASRDVFMTRLQIFVRPSRCTQHTAIYQVSFRHSVQADITFVERNSSESSPTSPRSEEHTSNSSHSGESRMPSSA